MDEERSDDSPLPEDWKAEYEQLGEDYRLFISTSWQATVAVLAVDGLLIGSAMSLNGPISSALLLIAGILTITMALTSLKWILRVRSRVKRLAYYDRRKGFTRFYPKERGFLTWPLGIVLFVLMITVGAGMIICAFYIIVSS